MRVIVDETLCEANGFCESLAPDIFEIGKSDVVHVADADVPEHLRAPTAASVLPASRRKSTCWWSDSGRSPVPARE
jgi:ferredoxin